MYTAPKEQRFTVLCKVLFLTHHIHLNILLSPPRSPLRVLNSPKGIFHTVSFHFLSILTNVVHFIVLQLKKNYSIIVYLTNCGLISFHGSLLYTSAMCLYRQTGFLLSQKGDSLSSVIPPYLCFSSSPQTFRRLESSR